MSLELPKSVVIIAAFLAVAITALQPALAAKRQTEMHDCPAGTKWSCETRPNTSKPTAASRAPSSPAITGVDMRIPRSADATDS
jgi:hypothetical protein